MLADNGMFSGGQCESRYCSESEFLLQTGDFTVFLKHQGLGVLAPRPDELQHIKLGMLRDAVGI